MPLEETAAQLRLIGDRVREFGDRGALNVLRKTIRAEAAPVLNAARERARSTLPKSGGLADHVADSRMRISTLTGLRNAGVRMQAMDIDTRTTNAGYARHPVFGDRNVWRNTQTLAALGWWTDTMEKSAVPITAAIDLQIQRAAALIAEGL